MYNLSNKMYLVSRQVGDLTSTEAKTFSTIHIFKGALLCILAEKERNVYYRF